MASELKVEKFYSPATKVVAPAGSSYNADYYTDGTADEVQINAAITAVDTAGGGKVLLTEGTFTVAAAIILASDVALEGQGQIATYIKCETAGIDVIQVHGADVDNFIIGVTLCDFRIQTADGVASEALSIKYAKLNNFENIQIYNFDSHGIHIQGSYDNNYRGIYVENCGKVSTSRAAVYLENLADANVNNESFVQLHVEPWEYCALHLGADNGSYNTHKNRFNNCKFHGDETTIAIIVEGDQNIFNNINIEKTGIAVTAVQLTSTAQGNIFQGILVDGEVGLAFDIDGPANIVDSVFMAASVVNGIDVSGNENIISNISLIGLSGWGITVSSNDCKLQNIDMYAGTVGVTLSGDRNILNAAAFNTLSDSGIVLSGSENVLTGVSPFWVGSGGNEACVVTGDENHIFGGKFNGSSNKTITFASGADNNRVFGAQVGKAITDSGTGNRFVGIQGYITENSGTATLVNGQTSIAVNHGLAVTPVAGDIMVTPIEAWGSMTEFYIDTYTSTQFTINADQDPGQDVDFCWKAIVL